MGQQEQIIPLQKLYNYFDINDLHIEKDCFVMALLIKGNSKFGYALSYYEDENEYLINGFEMTDSGMVASVDDTPDETFPNLYEGLIALGNICQK